MNKKLLSPIARGAPGKYAAPYHQQRRTEGLYTGAGDKQCRSLTMAGKHALKRTNMKCINARGIV